MAGNKALEKEIQQQQQSVISLSGSVVFIIIRIRRDNGKPIVDYLKPSFTPLLGFGTGNDKHSHGKFNVKRNNK